MCWVAFRTKDNNIVCLQKRKKAFLYDNWSRVLEIRKMIQYLNTNNVHPSNNNLEKIGFHRKTIIRYKDLEHSFFQTKPAIKKRNREMILPLEIYSINHVETHCPPQKKTKRNVSETMKKIVASEQRWYCYGCFYQLNACFEVDHIIRLDQGGSNKRDNLMALCRECHGLKTSHEIAYGECTLQTLRDLTKEKILVGVSRTTS